MALAINRPASKVKVERSAAAGMICVQRFLKPWRAMITCWTPNRATSPRFTAMAAPVLSTASGPPVNGTRPSVIRIKYINPATPSV